MTGKFRLEERTLDILKNFARINPSIRVEAGTGVIETISSGRTIFARACGLQPFPSEIRIYQLERFLQAVKTFNNKKRPPILSVEGEFVVISGGGRSIRYRQADPNDLILPPPYHRRREPVIADFYLTQEALARMVTAETKLGDDFGTVALLGTGGEIFLQVLNPGKFGHHEYLEMVGRTDADFRAVVKTECLEKLMRGEDYLVEILRNRDGKTLARFVGRHLEYLVAASG